MALLDLFKKTKAEEKLKRPSKGVLTSAPAEKTAPSVRPAAKRTGRTAAKKKEEGKEADSAAKEKSSETASRVILSPHITEKTTDSSEKGIYAFKVSVRANKNEIRQAIKELYGFEPEKIAVSNMPAKKRFVRRKVGFKSGYKKAVVHLKEGDKIELA
ncbi:MAG: 50S ribosomal protein L23 [Candidatus Pacebacteria bacterium]|nr:50S ribosomal protein L23 [Candidatus Paceibacterota bacterium]